MEDKDKKYLKGISKALYIITKVLKVLVIIAVPLIVLSMLVVGIVLSKFNYENNTLTFDNKIIATIEEDISGVKIVFDDDTKEEKNVVFDITKDFSESVAAIKIKDFFDKHTMSSIIWIVEISLLFAIIILVVTILLLRHAEKLFKNIHELDTPFTEENTLHLKQIGILFLIQMGISVVFDIISSLVVNVEVYTIDLKNIVQILIIFGLYYIFKYGTLMQGKSKMKIYE